ncbi:hypothetical protein [Paraburkholderia caballeronis]|uniref:hypothetical protein n=1 Tax=Paraburkholderia caballeronis TaxID=416943 RepID=UPI0014170796|nr:hypothetical protein [Paraburkholderia caballeronis]
MKVVMIDCLARRQLHHDPNRHHAGADDGRPKLPATVRGASAISTGVRTSVWTTAHVNG